ncbi:MAG: preprotein translocase subunit SecA [Planctomycetaceae bacterium]|nr:preprotein translocase subunit SecA [Planctomycetaceae bacterium]
MYVSMFSFASITAPTLRVARGTSRLVRAVLREAERLRGCCPEEFENRALRLRAAQCHAEHPTENLVECFGLAYEAVRRVRGIELHACQVSGGIVLARGGVAEMATGEGKTLTAVLPTVMWGMMGRGVHVITTNDYLADRDSHELKPIYESLGLSVACITQKLEPEARRQAYTRDITYATASEIGFDFLRDRMTLGPEHAQQRPYRYARLHQAAEGLLQRELFAAMVDEADSVLIDDARTPLIIGVESPHSIAMTSLYRWCLGKALELKLEDDFTLFPQQRQALLSDEGAQKILLGDKPAFGQGLATECLLQHVERMLEALYFYQCNKQYTVLNNEIVLLDESTDRTLEGRKLQRGLHHCLEAKEGLPLTTGTKTGSQVSVQSFFRMYRHLSGMTGTAWHARKEFRKIYRLKVTSVPTHRPCLRWGMPPRVFVSAEAKSRAIAEQSQALLAAGRAVLVGTPSVRASLVLSRCFQEAGIPHQILNAFHEAQEAEIIARAGQSNSLTIATNMAGRGTDIKLAEAVRNAGGLHVIVTDMNASGRVDRQLIGRAARQGDPGSYQYMLSLDDELFTGLQDSTKNGWKGRAWAGRGGEITSRWLRIFRGQQRRIERHHARQRHKMFKNEKKKREASLRMGLCPYLEADDTG